VPDTTEHEIERRIRERQERELMKNQVAKNTEAITGMRSEVAEKLEKLAHGLVEQITERWEDKIALMETRQDRKMDDQTIVMKGAIDKAIEDILGRVVLKDELPISVENQVNRVLSTKTNQQRTTVQFYVRTTVWIVAILSPIISATYAIWISRSGG
jgi:dsDNA-specific endonuclease/ATPase MutS2